MATHIPPRLLTPSALTALRPTAKALFAATLRLLQVVALIANVHVCTATAEPLQAPARADAKLPRHVAEMREALLAASRSGRLDDLYAVIDMSPTLPDVGNAHGTDAVAHLRAGSADGNGYDVLAALQEILSMPPAVLPFGRDLENNLIYVWPYLAERAYDTLTPAEHIDLHRLVDSSKIAEMRSRKRWTWWRIAIAADGSWVSFKRPD